MQLRTNRRCLTIAAVVVSAFIAYALFSSPSCPSTQNGSVAQSPKLRGHGWLWSMIVMYALAGGAALLAIITEPNGTPSILQILGVFITLISLWSSVRARTSQPALSSRWRTTFDWMTGIGTSLIATGIFLGAVDHLHPGWAAGLGIAIVALWGWLMFIANRDLT